MNTVQDNEKLYTPRQIKQAQTARELQHRMGYMSTQSLTSIVNSGGITNCPITAHDLIRANAIYGPAIPALKGKMRQLKSKPAHIEELPRIISSKLKLEMDIFFVNELPFLISKSIPLGLTLVTYLGGAGARSAATVFKALSSQLGAYRSERFSVTEVHCDGEGALAKLTPTLHTMGVKVNIHPPGTHCEIVERTIETLKGIMHA
jgi:hypothetical protein